MDPRGIKKGQKMAWDGQGRAGMGRALGALGSPDVVQSVPAWKTGNSSVRRRQFWTHFWLFWHDFDVFFRSYFSTWFRDRFSMISASVLTSFSHHFQIIFVSVFVSLENVISETPTKEIHGFAFWNVLRNMMKLGPKPALKTASKKTSKMMRKDSEKEGKNDVKITPGAFF